MPVLNESAMKAIEKASLNEELPPVPKEKYLRGLIDLEPYQPDCNDDLYSRDDKGIARLFADCYRNKHRYNSTRGSWMYYTGKKWENDERGLKASESLKKLQSSLLHYAMDKKEYYDFVVKYGSTGKRKNVLYDAQSVYPMRDEDLDNNLNLFNCQNGTYNLKTFRLQPHSPEDLITKISNVRYEKDKVSEAWMTFLNQIMMEDQEKIEYLQRAIGYALSASTEEECFFILYGSTTRNGKSTFIETILKMFGDYGASTEPATFQVMKTKDSGRATPQIANLVGCRFLKTSEPPQNMTFDVALLKTLTGGDTVPARRLYEAQFDFKPQFKLFMNTNHLPRVNDSTLFESDRVRVLTFDRQFTEAERDTKLKSKLCSEDNLSGIFNWAIEGYSQYTLKFHSLEEPQCVKDAIQHYKEDSDTIGQFISETLIPLDDKYTDGSLAYESYRYWISTLGQQAIGRNAFFRALKERGTMLERATVNSQTKRNIIKGYQLDEDWNPHKIAERKNVQSAKRAYSDRD